jgi:hypothetical protein
MRCRLSVSFIFINIPPPFLIDSLALLKSSSPFLKWELLTETQKGFCDQFAVTGHLVKNRFLKTGQ